MKTGNFVTEKYEDLIKEARFCRHRLPDIRNLAEKLPNDDELNKLLCETAEAEDRYAFYFLFVAGLLVDRSIDVKCMDKGINFFFDFIVLGAALLRCKGNAVKLLTDQVSYDSFQDDRKYQFVMLAAFVSYEKGIEPPPELIKQARMMAHLLDDSVTKMVIPDLYMMKLFNISVILNCLDDPALHQICSSYTILTESEYLKNAYNKIKNNLSHSFEIILSASSHYGEIKQGTVKRAVPKLGRNQPCHCGSGRKYKKCCFETDRKKVAQSTEIAGVTTHDLRENPELIIRTEKDFNKIPTIDLGRIDPAKIPEHLREPFAFYISRSWDSEALLAYLAKMEDVSFLGDFGHDIIFDFLSSGRDDLVERFLSLPGSNADDWVDDYCRFSWEFLKREEMPDDGLLQLEKACLMSLKGDNELLNPVDLAFCLMRSFPALGILMTRAVLPLCPAADEECLIQELLIARDRLGLSPSDPIETVMMDLWLSDTVDDESDSLEEVKGIRDHAGSLQQSIDEKDADIRQLTGKIEALKNSEAEFYEKIQQQQQKEEQKKDHREDHPVKEESAEMRELRQRYKSVKETMKQQHEQYREVSKDLEKVRLELTETRKQISGNNQKKQTEDQKTIAAEENLYGSERIPQSKQPIRLPEFTPGFSKLLFKLPEDIARHTMRSVGKLCAGEESVFQTCRPLKRSKETWRLRIGIHYRLLFELNEDTVIFRYIIHRRDLESTVKKMEA